MHKMESFNTSFKLNNLTLLQNNELLKKYTYLLCTVLISPIIAIGNIFVILSFIHSRRVRSPSNQLILYLAIFDLQLGLVMVFPFVIQDEQTSYGLELGLSLLTLFFMVSIALDKALSLAKSFIYCNVMTWTNVHIYSSFLVLGTFFVTILLIGQVPTVDRDFQIMIFGILLLPSLVITLSAYVYIYAVASKHIQAIRSVQVTVHSKAQREQFVQKNNNQTFPNSTHSYGNKIHFGLLKSRPFPKYGITLLITVVAILVSRLPASLSMFISGEHSEWSSHLLSLPLYICSAFNPWIYAYHNLEIKIIIKKLIRRAWKFYTSILYSSVQPMPKSHAKNPREKLILTRKQVIVTNSKSLNNSTVGLTQPNGATYHSNRMAVKLIHKSFNSVYFYDNNHPRISV